MTWARGGRGRPEEGGGDTVAFLAPGGSRAESRRPGAREQAERASGPLLPPPRRPPPPLVLPPPLRVRRTIQGLRCLFLPLAGLRLPLLPAAALPGPEPSPCLASAAHGAPRASQKQLRGREWDAPVPSPARVSLCPARSTSGSLTVGLGGQGEKVKWKGPTGHGARRTAHVAFSLSKAQDNFLKLCTPPNSFFHFLCAF